MNFENLYARVFVNEAENVDAPALAPDEIKSKVPTPDNYDVEPMPVPRGTASTVAGLEEYINKLQDFLETLNGTGSDSLQRFIVNAEGQSSLLKGIADETKDDIVKMAGGLASLVQTLKGFVAAADLRRKELAVNTSQV
jgi:hypothetical protein